MASVSESGRWAKLIIAVPGFPFLMLAFTADESRDAQNVGSEKFEGLGSRAEPAGPLPSKATPWQAEQLASYKAFPSVVSAHETEDINIALTATNRIWPPLMGNW